MPKLLGEHICEAEPENQKVMSSKRCQIQFLLPTSGEKNLLNRWFTSYDPVGTQSKDA